MGLKQVCSSQAKTKKAPMETTTNTQNYPVEFVCTIIFLEGGRLHYAKIMILVKI